MREGHNNSNHIMADTELALKKLRAEIDSGKEAIKLALENPLAASFADGLIIGALEDPSARLLRLAKKQKKLGEKEMELELEQEKKRVQSVVREFEELHPPVLESCPICLEDIKIHSTAEACTMFSCCGGWLCTTCVRKNVFPRRIETCPLCREAVPVEGDLLLWNKRLLSCVER